MVPPFSDHQQLTIYHKVIYNDWLVVWTPLKNISQLGWLFPIYGKIKNVPNHQPDDLANIWIIIKQFECYFPHKVHPMVHVWFYDQKSNLFRAERHHFHLNYPIIPTIRCWADSRTMEEKCSVQFPSFPHQEMDDSPIIRLFAHVGRTQYILIISSSKKWLINADVSQSSDSLNPWTIILLDRYPAPRTINPKLVSLGHFCPGLTNHQALPSMIMNKNIYI